MNNKQLEINAKVRVGSFGNKIGIIAKIKTKTCIVLVDGIKIEAPIDAVFLVSNKIKSKKTRTNSNRKIKKNNHKTPSLDLHGLTKDEAQSKIEFFLSDCLLADCDSCIIIHGIGTGVLKEFTHSLLSKFNSVKNYKIDDLNSGQTRVFL